MPRRDGSKKFCKGYEKIIRRKKIRFHDAPSVWEGKRWIGFKDTR